MKTVSCHLPPPAGAVGFSSAFYEVQFNEEMGHRDSYGNAPSA